MPSTGGSLKNLIERLNRPVEINPSRAGAVALLVLVITLVLLGVIYPLYSLKSGYQDTVEDLQFRLRRLQQVAGSRQALAQRLDKIKAMAGKNDTFLPTNTAALAAADLQTRIKKAVGDAGGELSSTQVVPERNEGNAVRITVKVRLTGSTPMLLKILHGFEAGKPYLFIENLNIRPIRMPRNPKDKNAGIDDKLNVDFDVIGYMQAP